MGVDIGADDWIPSAFRIVSMELPTCVAKALLGHLHVIGALILSPCCSWVMSSGLKSQVWSFDPWTHLWSVAPTVLCLFLSCHLLLGSVITGPPGWCVIKLETPPASILAFHCLVKQFTKFYTLEFVFPVNEICGGTLENEGCKTRALLTEVWEGAWGLTTRLLIYSFGVPCWEPGLKTCSPSIL